MNKVNVNITLPKDILECTEYAGELYREKISLDYLEDNYETVEFVIYSNVQVIPIGFLIGLFKDSISKFKSEDYFFNKFKFNYSGSEKYYDCIMDDIYTAILRLIPQHCK